MNDTAYAFRLMRRRPASTVVAVLTMALGIGSTTVLFSVAAGVLMKALPWPESDRLIRIHETREGSTGAPRPLMTNATYLEWRDHARTLSGIAAWSAQTATLTGVGEPRRVRVAAVTASLFAVLRVAPERGAAFTSADEPGDDRAIIAHALWQRDLGGAADVVGRALTLDGRPYTIAAIMPAAFEFPDRETQIWTPFQIRPVIGDRPEVRRIQFFSALGRLNAGVTPQQAAEEGTALGRHAPDAGLAAIAVFGSRGAVRVHATPMLDAITADVRPALLLLLAAVGLLLAAATGNVASVQLARSTTRVREMAVRAAIGAGTGRLARQLFVESLATGLLGGTAGLLLAALLHQLLPLVLPAGFPRVNDISLDGRVILFATLISIVTGIAFGLVPAVHVRRLNLTASLAEGGTAPVGSGRSRTSRARAAIMAGQVAVAVVLLVGASLLLRSFLAMLAADRGYQVDNVLSARLPMPDANYTGPRRAAVLQNILERLGRMPGVTHAAFTTVLPLTPGEQMLAFTMPRADGDPLQVRANLRTVSAQYFAAMRIRLIAGRGFTEDDTATSLPVVVVNRAFARQYLAEPAVGRTIPAALEEGRNAWQIIGVAADIRTRSVTDAAQPEMYVCFTQQSRRGVTSDPSLVVRTTGDPVALATSLREVVRQLDPSLAIDSVMSMEERLLRTLAQPRLYAIVVAGFAFFAVVIAGVGLFGVLSYSVAQRSREIGVRTALGARPIDILRLVVGHGAAVTSIGLAVGLVIAFLAARAMSTQLYGVAAFDRVTFIGAPLLLTGVALLACLVPARRAARIDPLRALRG